jgi:D-alanine-D-alanine ligase
VDLRLDADGVPSFLEVNPLPGIAPGWGDIMVLGERVGIGYGDMIGRIVAAAIARLGL